MGKNFYLAGVLAAGALLAGVARPAWADAAEDIALGEKLYRREGCRTCHGMTGGDSPAFPNLLTSPKTGDRKAFAAIVMEGKPPMPAYKDNAKVAAGLDYLYAYLSSLKLANGLKPEPDHGACQGSKSFNLVSSLVMFGYNRFELPSIGHGNPDTLAGQGWKNFAEAARFAVAVLGEKEITVTPGQGLLAQAKKERDAVASQLAELVKNNAPPPAGSPAQAGDIRTVLRRDALDAVRKLPADQQSAAIDKLAMEAAVAANIERALTLRRLLLAGQSGLSGYSGGIDQDVQRLVAVLDREIDQLLYEASVRKKLLSVSAAAPP